MLKYNQNISLLARKTELRLTGKSSVSIIKISVPSNKTVISILQCWHFIAYIKYRRFWIEIKLCKINMSLKYLPVKFSFGHQPRAQSIQVNSSSKNWFSLQATQTQQHLTLFDCMLYNWRKSHQLRKHTSYKKL